MIYYPTTEDLMLLKQHNKTIYTKVELLNKDRFPLGELQGEIIEGNSSIQSDSDIRRTCGMSFVIKDSSYLFGTINSKWALTNFLKIYIGFNNIKTNTIKWYNIGIYVFDSAQYTYNATTKSISLSCSDLTTYLNGTYGGIIAEEQAQLIDMKKGSAIIRDGMIQVLSMLNEEGQPQVIKDWSIEEIGEYVSVKRNELGFSTQEDYNKIPYDIVFEIGSSALDIIVALRDLYPAYETFFDIDGTFHCQMIPTFSELDLPVLTYETLEPLVIDEQISHDYTSIKNHVIVFGKEIESDYYCAQSIVSPLGDHIARATVTNPDFTQYSNGQEFSVKFSAANINVNSLEMITTTETVLIAYTITQDGVSIPTYSGLFQPDTVYTFRYTETSEPGKEPKGFELLGQFQVRAEAKNLNDNEFGIETIGDRLIILSGGEYDNITSDIAALERAEFELWLRSRVTASLNITIVLIPWLDVNQKIRYKSHIFNEEKDYIIKNISFDFASGTQTLSLIEYADYYPASITNKIYE